MKEPSELQQLLDKAMREAEERGRKIGVAQEMARVRDSLRRIEAVFVANGNAGGVLVDGKIYKAFDGTLASALAEMIGIDTRP